ncbi:MAG: major capsid protein [Microvirus sp.]|nr:MAG: major capsid protein [Microvirus sp.]
MYRNQSAVTQKFAMVPRAEIPRSTFKMPKTLKTTFDASVLVPIFCEEVLPGDTWSVNMTAFARLATPIFPIMDNLYLDTFFFFVPNRLVWTNWVKFMGEQNSPTDSISFTVPTCTSPAGGSAVGSIFDHFGIPVAGQVGGGNTITFNALPLRAYNRIWQNWFRDENLIATGANILNQNDGPDPATDFTLLKRGKRPDYFTTCLPWPQKGNTAVSLPLGSTAPLRSDGNSPIIRGGAGANAGLQFTAGTVGTAATLQFATSAGALNFGTAGTAFTGIYADLSTATAATINQLRTAFQIQRLLERDARGGTRYTEIIRSHFGVISPDQRLQRPEYLGGGTTPLILNPVAQTSGTNASGTTTPLGNLAAVGTILSRNGFSQSFTEHGYIIGLANVRADLTYQQGLRKMFSRSTRYDFYFPVFANLGEQAVLNKEIYMDGSANDNNVFGYQERWGEYRYSPNQINALFRSTAAGTIDAWHLAQRFSVLPTLGPTFMEEAVPLQRALAVGAAANGAQIIFDSYFDMTATRPLPMYSVPGMIDHF